MARRRHFLFLAMTVRADEGATRLRSRSPVFDCCARYAGIAMIGRTYFADKPVKTSRLPAFRAEHFPCSGPYPWLDQPNALQEIHNRLKRNEISESDASLCRYWSANGYVIL